MLLLQADVLELKANPNAPALRAHHRVAARRRPRPGRDDARPARHAAAGRRGRRRRRLGQGARDARRERRRASRTPAPRCRSRSSASTIRRSPARRARVVDSERDGARSWRSSAPQRLRAEALARRQKTVSLEHLFDAIKAGGVRELNLIIKADVQGSVEAALGEVQKIKSDEVAVRVIHTGVGAHRRVRHQPRRGVEGDRRRLQRAAERRGQGARRSRGRRHPHLPRHLPADRGHREGARRPARAGHGGGRHSARPRCARCSEGSRLGSIAGCMVTTGKIERSARVRVVREGSARLGRRHRLAQHAPGGRARGRGRASSAASCSRATTTSRRATSSSATSRARSSAARSPASRPASGVTGDVRRVGAVSPAETLRGSGLRSGAIWQGAQGRCNANDSLALTEDAPDGA